MILLDWNFEVLFLAFLDKEKIHYQEAIALVLFP